MQDDVSELLRSAIREYKQTKVCFIPINTLFARNATLQGSCCHKHPPPHLQATSSPVLLYHLWWQNITVNGSKRPTCREVKCTCLHKDLLTAHLGTALCPFSCIRLSPALVNTTLWYCPALVLTLCWQRHKWELTLGIERGIFHFTYPHREMCWGCGNVYIRQSDFFFSRWSCNGTWRKKGNRPLKCIIH